MEIGFKSAIVSGLLIVGLMTSGSFAEEARGGTEYHVALSGNNGNIGSEAFPFRTVARGFQELAAGDTLTIHPGDYGQEFDILLTTSGTPNSPITVRAQSPGTVVLRGSRMPGEVNGGGDGIKLEDVSHVTIDGLYMTNYNAAIRVSGELVGEPDFAGDITVQRSTFENNGADGIIIWKADRVRVTDCTFISLVPEGGWPGGVMSAIQDYGVSIYHSTGTIVENSYFYGAHNQALSFKQDVHSSVARRNIFEGALHTAIYLGQNRREHGRPKSVDLLAELNIVRGTEGFRVKSPLRIDNCENATVRYNYFEGFDETNNTSAVTVFNEALGQIEIYDNIAAFGMDNPNSCGVGLLSGLDEGTMITVHHNNFYEIRKDLCGVLDGNDSFDRNLSYQCNYFINGDPLNYQGDPSFAAGDPVQLPISATPTEYDFESYYRQLTDPFRLSEGSPAQGYGYSFTLFVDGFESGDTSAWSNTAP